jgi:UDPglucose--hexose-1-phosphate uridylyltransferase
MPLLRFDHTTADWVVFAPLRKLRPHHESDEPQAAAESAVAEQTKSCPFCPGNEKMTPPEIYAVRPPNSDNRADWRVRVTANKFPALRIEEDHHRVEEGRVFQMMGGCGAHEVVVESPDHFLLLGQQPVEQVELVLRAAQSRYVDLLRDKRFQSVIVFKNHGEAAGTSLKHPHWQVIATPVVPRLLRLKHIAATEYFDRTGSSVYRVMVEEELKRSPGVHEPRFCGIRSLCGPSAVRDVDSAARRTRHSIRKA